MFIIMKILISVPKTLNISLNLKKRILKNSNFISSLRIIRNNVLDNFFKENNSEKYK